MHHSGQPPHLLSVGMSDAVGAHVRTRHHFALRNYHYSKLANVLFTQEFNSRIYTAGGVSAFVLHPGVIDTGLGRHGGITNFLLYKVCLLCSC